MQEHVSIVTLAMILLMEIVFSHLQIYKAQLTKDADYGKMEYAVNVQEDLLSMLIVHAFKFLIFAEPHKDSDAQDAIKATS